MIPFPSLKTCLRWIVPLEGEDNPAPALNLPLPQIPIEEESIESLKTKLILANQQIQAINEDWEYRVAAELAPLKAKLHHLQQQLADAHFQNQQLKERLGERHASN